MRDINRILRRGDCFKLLAACFYEPEKSLLVEEQVAENLASLLENQTSSAAVAARAMQSALYSIKQEQLAIDHAALFVGPFELIAAPYGSVYTEKTRRVMGESTMKTARYYQEAGLSVELKEPPDHIVIELEFMYFLCSKEVHALTEGLIDEALDFRKMQVRFYYDAMKPWVSHFCDAVRTGTDNDFYVHLADCLNFFLLSCEEIYDKVQSPSAD